MARYHELRREERDVTMAASRIRTVQRAAMEDVTAQLAGPGDGEAGPLRTAALHAADTAMRNLFGRLGTLPSPSAGRPRHRRSV